MSSHEGAPVLIIQKMDTLICRPKRLKKRLWAIFRKWTGEWWSPR